VKSRAGGWQVAGLFFRDDSSPGSRTAAEIGDPRRDPSNLMPLKRP